MSHVILALLIGVVVASVVNVTLPLLAALAFGLIAALIMMRFEAERIEHGRAPAWLH